MHDDIWYEEELLPPETMLAETSKSLQQVAIQKLAQELEMNEAALTQNKALAVGRFARKNAKGRLTVHRPRARRIMAEEVGDWAGNSASGVGGPLAPGKLAQGPLFLIRLGMELDVEPEGRAAGWGYRQAWCRANLFSPTGEVQPRLLDIFPQRLYEGQPTTIQLKAGPSLKVEGMVEASLGSVAADLRLGQVTPVTLGFFGEGERKPYWELQEKERPIRGLYHFWLLVEQPPGCEAVCLAMLGEGDLQTSLFTIPVGPTVSMRDWRNRRQSCLTEMLA